MATHEGSRLDSPTVAVSESRVVVLLALSANLAIAVVKFVAAGISGSTAMLAEGFHSIADSGNQLFLLRGAAAGGKESSAAHPFGHGKEAYFWSFMVAVFLFVGGGVVAFVEGLDRLRFPKQPKGGLVLSLVVLGIAAFFELMVAFRPARKIFNRRRGSRGVWREIRQTKDPTLLVVLFEDSVAVLGLTVAAAGLLITEATGSPRWDGVASMVIGLLLTASAAILAVETKGLLVGESAGRATVSAIRGAALSVREVEVVERLLTMHLGPDEILVNMDLAVREGLSGAEMEAVTDRVEQEIRRLVPQATRIFIELGPLP
jgi:cation diffusion facilitator family transporter